VLDRACSQHFSAVKSLETEKTNAWSQHFSAGGKR
jgi:hypothetical protein